MIIHAVLFSAGKFGSAWTFVCNRISLSSFHFCLGKFDCLQFMTDVSVALFDVGSGVCGRVLVS